MKSTDPQTQPVDQTRTGILITIFGLSVAAFTGALMKLMSNELSAFQITWFRFLGFAIILLPIVWRKFGRGCYEVRRPSIQIVRGISLASATVCFVVGARTIDFADAIAILYAYPFLLTVMATLFLGERVRVVGWLGVVGGFFGVLLVMQPRLDGVNTGTLFVFLCAVIVAFQMILNRKLGAISHPLLTSFWGAIIATLILSVTIPFIWQPVSSEHLGWLVLIAITGAVNQTCIVYGFAKAEASVLAPFTYFEILAGVVFGLVMFGTLPNPIAWFGILLIAGCGLIVARSLPNRSGVRRGAKF